MARQKEKGQQESCSKNKNTVQQFCENTSLHGLKYVFEEGSFFLERYRKHNVFRNSRFRFLSCALSKLELLKDFSAFKQPL